MLAFLQTAKKNILNVDNDIEKRIKREVYQRGIRIKDFFYDYDKLRKGTMTEDKVIREDAIPNHFNKESL